MLKKKQKKLLTIRLAGGAGAGPLGFPEGGGGGIDGRFFRSIARAVTHGRHMNISLPSSSALQTTGFRPHFSQTFFEPDGELIQSIEMIFVFLFLLIRLNTILAATACSLPNLGGGT